MSVFLQSWLDWHELMRGWGVDPRRAGSRFEEICEHYSAAGRHYHTLDHVHQVLQTVARLGEHALHLGAVKLAAWLHDVVYDSRASNNEERSAEYARRLCEELGVPDRARVAELIRKTRRHDAAGDVDAQVLIDADLAILGAGEDEYRSYAANIRREYQWVAESDYREGRRRVLDGFLRRPQIYHLLSEREPWARHNMTAEIAELSSSPAGAE